ncbi:MFS transporter [Kibdelosporangium aridum]|uniref:MFS transporter n=1 Tax=Kibdelosporangium aridum TaxID=2030 RepID=A0A428YN43_KIBAR|nr:MFS transporter [Kibdelosporangium aridum]RSM69674.1 MFS transporter [Kibdelosporangium aridum]
MTPNTPTTVRTGWIVVLVVTVQFMASLDLSVVNVALPAIRDDLGFTAAALSWVVNAYTLVYGGLLLLGGRLGDILGRRTVLLTGLALFALASLAGGLAQQPWQLIAARAAQGLGGAMLTPLTLALVTVTFPEGVARSRALGAWAASTVLGGAIGVVASGLLTAYAGWQWVFYLNIPIAVLAVVVGVVHLPGGRAEQRPRLDFWGAVLATTGSVALVLGVVRTEELGWGSMTTLATFAVALVLLAGFAVAETRVRQPLMRLDLFTRRPFLAANMFGFLITAGQLAGFYFVSLHVQRVLDYSPVTAGVAFLPFCLGAVLGMAFATKNVARLGARQILVVGGLLGAAGIAWFGLAGPGGSFWAELLGPSLVASVGIGASFVAMGTAATTGIPPSDAGMASGMLNSSRLLGGSIGLAVLSTIATTVTANTGNPQTTSALSEGYSAALLVGGALIAVGALSCLTIPAKSTMEARATTTAKEHR